MERKRGREDGKEVGLNQRKESREKVKNGIVQDGKMERRKRGREE